MQFVIDHSYLIPLLPLLGAIVAGFFGERFLKGQSHWPIWIGVGLAAVMSLTLLFGMINEARGAEGPISHLSHWYTWIDAAAMARTTASSSPTPARSLIR